MALRTVVKYAALSIGLLVLASVAVSVVSAILSVVWAAVTALVTAAVVVAVLYAAYRGGSWLRRRDGSDGGGAADTPAEASVASGASGASDPTDPVERLRERYVSGDLTEAEFERRLGRALGGPDRDAIDRELGRERSRE